MIFQREQLDDGLWEEISPLLRAHWQEIARWHDIPLNPDVDFYYRTQELGMLRIFVARTSYRLVGYAVFFVKPNPHYKDSVQAVQDILYFAPSMRKGTNGIKFLKYCDVALAGEGIQAVYHHVKVYKDFGKVLERMGYEEVDKIYAKRLDNGSQRSNSRSWSSGRGVRVQPHGPEATILTGNPDPDRGAERADDPSGGSEGGSGAGRRSPAPAHPEFEGA